MASRLLLRGCPTVTPAVLTLSDCWSELPRLARFCAFENLFLKHQEKRVTTWVHLPSFSQTKLGFDQLALPPGTPHLPHPLSRHPISNSNPSTEMTFPDYTVHRAGDSSVAEWSPSHTASSIVNFEHPSPPRRNLYPKHHHRSSLQLPFPDLSEYHSPLCSGLSHTRDAYRVLPGSELTMETRRASNLHRATWLFLLSAGTKGVCHPWLFFF